MKKKIIIVVLVILIAFGGVVAANQKVDKVGIKLKQYNDLPYALCAASGTRPLNQFIWVNGYKFRLGLSVCPIITTGTSFANLDLTRGKLTPDGTSKTVWSLFGMPSSFPQKQTDGTWVYGAGVIRNFKTTRTPGGASSNQWSFPCVVDTKTLTATNGETFSVAVCKGPMMENVNNKPIAYGSRVFTQAPKGIPNPIVAQLSTIIPGLK